MTKHFDKAVYAEAIDLAAHQIADPRLGHAQEFRRLLLRQAPLSMISVSRIMRSARPLRFSASASVNPRSRQRFLEAGRILTGIYPSFLTNSSLRERFGSDAWAMGS